MPVWHVSVSVKNAKGHPKPFRKLTREHINRCKSLAFEILDGVGKTGSAFVTNPPGACVHVQKPLTEEEIAQLPPGWMAIPAIDERGPVIPI